MSFSTSSNKLLGVLGLISALFCFSPFLLIEKSKLIYHEADLFIIKYFGPTLLLNAGVFFLTFGVLHCLGILIPYYSQNIDGYGKARHHLLAIVISVPFWISSSAVVFVMANTNLFKVLWTLILVCIVLIFFSSVRVLRRRGRA